ncbi:MAG: TraX family protein [Eubacteriales bacterium]
MIKWIAVLLMIVDHIGYYLGFLMPEPVVIGLRLIGRLSFPIFAYYIALGFLRTKNRTRYFLRMFLFACITQAMLAVTAYLTHTGTFTNVMFTFSLAILMMAAAEFLEKTSRSLLTGNSQNSAAGDPKNGREEKTSSSPKVEIYGHSISASLGSVLAMLLIILIIGLTTFFNPDYNIFGMFYVYIFYIIQKNIRKPGLTLAEDRHALKIMILSILGLNLAWALFNISFSSTAMYWILMEIFSVFSIGILLLDKPRPKPARWEKYFFYVFYPAHLVLLMLLKYSLSIS